MLDGKRERVCVWSGPEAEWCGGGLRPRLAPGAWHLVPGACVLLLLLLLPVEAADGCRGRWTPMAKFNGASVVRGTFCRALGRKCLECRCSDGRWAAALALA